MITFGIDGSSWNAPQVVSPLSVIDELFKFSGMKLLLPILINVAVIKVAGILLFPTYTASLIPFIISHGFQAHAYTDDFQAYHH